MEKFTIQFDPSVRKEIKELSTFRRTEILDKIETQLTAEPTKVARNRKYISGVKPPWSEAEGFWELRIGEYRAFYEVDENEKTVTVHAIRRKPPDKTTEEIL